MSKNALSQSHSVRKFPGKLFLRLVRQNREQTQTFTAISATAGILERPRRLVSSTNENLRSRRAKKFHSEHLLNLPRQF